jgi:hypothetical protein
MGWGASGLAWLDGGQRPGDFASFLLIRMGVSIGEDQLCAGSQSQIGDLLRRISVREPITIFYAWAAAGVLHYKVRWSGVCEGSWRAVLHNTAVPGGDPGAVDVSSSSRSPSAARLSVLSRTPPIRPLRRCWRSAFSWWLVMAGLANFATYACSFQFMVPMLQRYF